MYGLVRQRGVSGVLTGNGSSGGRALGGAYGDASVRIIPDAPVWASNVPTSNVAYRGAPQTIEVMQRAALDDHKHFATRQLAETVCEGIDSKDYSSEYLALYHYLIQHSRYMRDPRRAELVRAPHIVSKMILAGRRPSLDCDDMATWLGAAVLAVGGTAWFATVAFTNQFVGTQRQYSHVLTCALEPRSGQRIVLDPVAAENTKQMLKRATAARLWGPLN